MILSVFGAYWIFAVPKGIIGFFSTVEEATKYVHGISTEAKKAGDE